MGEWNGMEWVKILGINRDRKKVWKNFEGVQNCYDEIGKKIENRREWTIPSQNESVISSLWCKEWNGGKNEIS